MATETAQTANSLVVQNSELQTVYNAEGLQQFRTALANFTRLLNAEPRPESIDSTPDGNARTLVISHVEMLLDELFFGLWNTEGFKWNQIANEVVGSLELVVIHPVTMKETRRTGAACVQITVDAVPNEYKDTPQDSYAQKMEKKQKRNLWALSTDNKKPNALDLTFPKLKAECLKNAALSFGKVFGRDLNRKISAPAIPIKKTKASAATAATENLLKKE